MITMQISPGPSFSKRGSVMEDEEFGTASEKVPLFKGGQQGDLVFPKWR
jgi:hypothetical protein